MAWWLGGPLIFIATVCIPSFRRHWAGRWGFRAPAIEPGSTWIHAASVGEGRAAEAICEALTSQRDGHVLLRTATSRTGLEQARGQHVQAPLPLDHPWVVRAWLDKVRPSILVLVEAELWPNLLLSCLGRGIPVIVASARVGRGTRRFRGLFPGLFGRVARSVGLWMAVDEETAEWLRVCVPGQVDIGGEPKADFTPGPALVFSRAPIVAGSTRAGEEALLLTAFQNLVDPPLLVLAPRHPSRFGEVGELLEQSGLRWRLRSEVLTEVEADVEVLLLDSLGELAGLYDSAAAAFVGGTFLPHIGGHSPVEPASRGVALVCGPYTGAHRGAWSQLEPHVAADPNGLALALQEALDAEGAPVFQLGASARVATAVSAHRLATPPDERPMRPLLTPLGWVWMALVSYRNLFWSLFPSVRTGGPVISVGSLGSGGAGKTVVAQWLVEALRDQGVPSAVVSRGYGRLRSGRFVRTSRERSDASWLGDEPAMLSARGCRVVSSPNRVAGAEVAFSQGAEVVVLDDAFQHRRIARDLDIVVMDGRWPEEGGAIPSGERREPLDSLRRADVVWVRDGGVPDHLRAGLKPGTLVVQARVVSVCWLRGNEEFPLDALEDRAVCAFAGIARPGRFLEHLAGLGVRVKGWRVFRDHHRFTEADIEQLLQWARGRPLVTTEKDRVRLPADLEVWALRVRTEPFAGVVELQAKLAEFAS
ncbi:MAG: tetraacyldisaccharide 4'-kinase [Myxococcota bacterium]|nr:tetraacyldisaccharide 4'-kinase [Myxococcota bacterium]